MQLILDFIFYGFAPTAFKLKEGWLSCTLWLLYGWSEDKSSQWKSLFLFFCRSELYSYHRNKIATRYMQGKTQHGFDATAFFFLSLNIPERMRQGFDWSVTYSKKKRKKKHFLNLCFVLLKNKLILSQIHFNGDSPIAGLGNMRGEGFVFLKHYQCQCICWLYYVASYPSQTCKVSIFVFHVDLS